MHNCEEFRERITEHILDREDVASKVGLRDELLMCSSCADFYAQSQEMMEALDSVELSISQTEWKGIEQRLHARILNTEHIVATPVVATAAVATAVGAGFSRRGVKRTLGLRFGLGFSLAAAFLLTIGLARLPIPLSITSVQPPVDAAPVIYAEHAVPLDPVTVDFLEQSELLLRNIMKIEPADVEDLAQAKAVARQQLAEVEQRKEAAADVPPVVNVIDTYETILRDIRNVDDKTADEDINDIQKRIQQNGLIANMKAFQPRLMDVSYRRR